MGFLDKLKEGVKKVADKVTGGYGKLEMMIDRTEFTPGEQVSISLVVNATGELKAKRVLVRLRGVETISYEVPVEEKDASGNVINHRNEKKTLAAETLMKEYEVHGELNMTEGQTQPIIQFITLPQECKPTYMGINCTHQWTLEGEIDVPWGADVRAKRDITIR